MPLMLRAQTHDRHPHFGHIPPNGPWTGIGKNRKLIMLEPSEVLNDLKSPPGNRLEPLEGSRKGQHSIRINKQWRVCFRWTEDGPENVEITDYH